MVQIVLEAKPNEASEDYGKLQGAIVVLFINYKDIEGVFELGKYYVESNNWTIIRIEDEYSIIDFKQDMDDSYQQYYEEVIENGYSIIYNAYEKE